MARTTENERLKSRIKVLEQHVHRLSADMEALELRCSRQFLDQLKIQTNVGMVRDDLKYADKMRGKLSAHVASRILEFRDRITALENFTFKNAGDLGDLQRIIGPLNDKTPPHLDKPKGIPRRR